MGFRRAKVHHGYSFFLLIFAAVGVSSLAACFALDRRSNRSIDNRCGAFLPAEMITNSYVRVAHLTQNRFLHELS